MLPKQEQSAIKAGYDPFSWFSSCDGYATLTASAYIVSDETLDYDTAEGHIVFTILHEEAYNNCLDGNI